MIGIVSRQINAPHVNVNSFASRSVCLQISLTEGSSSSQNSRIYPSIDPRAARKRNSDAIDSMEIGGPYTARVRD